MKPPRLLIEEWLPAAAIGVECMREEGSLSAKPPTKYIHVWWARRPLVASRAAVLASLLPAGFPRDVFERLLGFGRPSNEIVELRRIMDSGVQLGGFGFPRAFSGSLDDSDLRFAHSAAEQLWGKEVIIIDPMAGGGSIPLEAARLGFHTLANEYNAVGCSLLEVTVDYPFRHGVELAVQARRWGGKLRTRFLSRMERFFPKVGLARPDGYIFARTVPCPDTHHQTPLVPDWHLLKPKSGRAIVAQPLVDKARGTWTVRILELGNRAGQLRQPPRPSYDDGKGISLFTDQQIPSDYIKAKAQAGEMGSTLYAIAIKTQKGLRFQPPEDADLKALDEAAKGLARVRKEWEGANVIPTETIPVGDKTGESLIRGITTWADMFAPRQLLAIGVLIEELRKLRLEIIKEEGSEFGEAVVHLLALAVDKLANHNCNQSRWESGRGAIKGKMDRHDFAFKPTYAELGVCNPGAGVEWTVNNVIKAYEEIADLPRHPSPRPVEVSIGSATSLPQLADGSVTAVVVDPPYAGNVQYSELADFFYVWLKRTQGHRRPEWFSTYLCERDMEAVVNISRHRTGGVASSKKGKRDGSAAEARRQAHAFYQGLMTNTFKECRRILRDDGVLTVMFTHKQQEAWESLFSSLIRSGFTTTATWPVKTESEYSLHQAKKNAAQSTVILVARKRPPGSGVGYFDSAMQREIRERARASAERLQKEGLNPVDQLVGSFGPAIEVYSRYDEVRTDTGQPVGVDRAIDEASDAVSKWRVDQIASRGLEGVEPEGRFALLCWDVLGAAEFRFNEAKLLGHAVGMDVEQLAAAGLVSKEGDKIKILPAKERRRARALEPDETTETLFGPVIVGRRRTKKQALKVHPNDPRFRTALDGCHAMALRFVEAGGGAGGIGSAKALARQQRWGRESAVAQLMEALVRAAPVAVRHDKGKKSAAAQFPEFRAWHGLLEPLFGITPPDWTEKAPPQGMLFAESASDWDDESGFEPDETGENAPEG